MTDAAGERTGFCYRHPDRQSFVLCQRCGRTVCPECQTQRRRRHLPRVHEGAARGAPPHEAGRAHAHAVGGGSRCARRDVQSHRRHVRGVPAAAHSRARGHEPAVLLAGLRERRRARAPEQLRVRTVAAHHDGLRAFHGPDLPCAAQHVHVVDLRAVAGGAPRALAVPLALPHRGAGRIGRRRLAGRPDGRSGGGHRARSSASWARSS